MMRNILSFSNNNSTICICKGGEPVSNTISFDCDYRHSSSQVHPFIVRHEFVLLYVRTTSCARQNAGLDFAVVPCRCCTLSPSSTFPPSYAIFPVPSFPTVPTETLNRVSNFASTLRVEISSRWDGQPHFPLVSHSGSDKEKLWSCTRK